MRTVEEVRRLRLCMLRDRLGTLSEINERLGLLRRDSTLSQILNSSKGASGKPKEMGSTLARRLEQALGLEVGWMDNDPAYDEAVESRLSVDALKVAREFDQFSPEHKAAMLTMWETLKAVAQPPGQTASATPVPAPTVHDLPRKKAH